MSASARGRRLVAVAGVATGVGFSIMMAALMEGSQHDFMRQLIDALPHITVSDERRQAPRAAGRDGLRGRRDPRPYARGAPQAASRIRWPSWRALEAWVPGAVAPSVKTQALIRYASRDVAASITGIDPHREPKVSMLATQMRQGTLASLYRANNAIILGDRLAEKIGARRRLQHHACRPPTARASTRRWSGCSASGIRSVDESTAYVLVKTGQILAQQTGLVNEIRVRVSDPMAGARRGAAHRARDRLQVGVVAGGARGPAQRLRGAQHHHVHRGRRDPAGGELRHLQHHLHHHAREGARHRDHEVARAARSAPCAASSCSRRC